MWQALAALLGPIIGSQISADATSEASAASSEAMQAQIDEMRRQFDLIYNDNQMARDLGNVAMIRQAQMMGLGDQMMQSIDSEIADLQSQLSGAEDDTARQDLERRLTTLRNNRETLGQDYEYQESPYMAARRERTNAALETAQAGRQFGGRAMREIARVNDQLTQEDFTNQFSMLSQMVGTGENAGSRNASAGMNTGAGISSAIGNNAIMQNQLTMQNATNQNAMLQGGLQNALTMFQYGNMMNSIGA